jgi:hypothetical protein
VLIDAIKRHVPDPEVRDRIREAILEKLPATDAREGEEAA